MSELDPILQKEIEQWSQRIAKFCGQTERADELQDHLYCEIERLMQQEQIEPKLAFDLATKQLGDEARLQKELAKNNDLVGHLCAVQTAFEEGFHEEFDTKWTLRQGIWMLPLMFLIAWFFSAGGDTWAEQLDSLIKALFKVSFAIVVVSLALFFGGLMLLKLTKGAVAIWKRKAQ